MEIRNSLLSVEEYGLDFHGNNVKKHRPQINGVVEVVQQVLTHRHLPLLNLTLKSQEGYMKVTAISCLLSKLTHTLS